MVKQMMTSMGSHSMAKRNSIGMANLTDRLPISPTNRPTNSFKQQQQKRKRKSIKAESRLPPTVPTTTSITSLSFATGERSSHCTEDTAVTQVREPEPTLAPVPAPAVQEKEVDTQVLIPEASPSESTTPTTATTSATTTATVVTGADLYAAIGRDEFFECIADHAIELCGSEEEAAQRLHHLLHTGGFVNLINVNDFSDPSTRKTLLHLACKKGDVDVIKCLLYHGASATEQCAMGRSAFHDVISAGKRDHTLCVLETLYEYEPQGLSLVDIHGTHVIHLAAIHGCLDVLQWCAKTLGIAMSITSFSGRNVLHYAAYNGRMDVLQWLLLDQVQDHRQGNKGATVSITSLDVNGYSVLHYASMGGHLKICQWLVCHAPHAHDLPLVSTNSDGNTAADLAKQHELQAFLEEISQVPCMPRDVRCIGADSSSLGISWTLEQHHIDSTTTSTGSITTTTAHKDEDDEEDALIRRVLAPKWVEIEFTKKPSGLRRASSMLAMLISSATSSAGAGGTSGGGAASSYLFSWEKLAVLVQPDASEYWLSGLDSDCEYLVRMRALNRNGYSEYSLPNFDSSGGGFQTTATGSTGGSSAASKPLSSSLSLSYSRNPSRGLMEMSFIGTLTLELLEARRLLYCDVGHPSSSCSSSSPSTRSPFMSRRDAAGHGRFFGVVTLQVPLEPRPDDSSSQDNRSSSSSSCSSGSSFQRRRTSLSQFNSSTSGGASRATRNVISTVQQMATCEMRCLYKMRTEFASVQQELIAAGSLHAFRHPFFGLHTKIRVPEALDSELILEIHQDTTPSLSQSTTVVGVVRIPVMDLVRGFPAKLQWLALDHGGGGGIPTTGGSGCHRPHGELLVRSLFLADGITELPHPTKLDVYCSTAEELLDETTTDDSTDTTTMSKAPRPSSFLGSEMPSSSAAMMRSPTATSSSSSQVSPRWANRTNKYDALGFSIWPPSRTASAGAGATGPVAPPRQTYEYYRLHQQCLARQQESLWLKFHEDLVPPSSPSSSLPPPLEAEAAITPLTEQQRLGVRLMKHPHEAALYEPSQVRNTSRLRRLVWDGIPASCRRVLYLRMSGAEAKRRAAVNGLYAQLRTQAMALKTASDAGKTDKMCRPDGLDIARKQIQVDLQRTFAGNQSWINTRDGQDAMERVLLAYAIHNPHIGYCQSMSFIVARLLCLFHSHEDQDAQEEKDVHKVEEDVFWLLAALCEDYFPAYFTKGMDGLHVDGLVLEALLPKRLPKVMRHFQLVFQNHPAQMGLLLVTGWLLPMFCTVFPSETSFRLLDVVIYERSNVVFSLVLTLLRMAQPQLLHETKDYTQLFRVLKARDQRLHDASLLLEIALEEHLLLEKGCEELRQQCGKQHRAAAAPVAMPERHQSHRRTSQFF